MFLPARTTPVHSTHNLGTVQVLRWLSQHLEPISAASQHIRAALSNIPDSHVLLALLLLTAVGQGLPGPSDKDSRGILLRKDCSKIIGMGAELAINPQNKLTENKVFTKSYSSPAKVW